MNSIMVLYTLYRVRRGESMEGPSPSLNKVSQFLWRTCPVSVYSPPFLNKPGPFTPSTDQSVTFIFSGTYEIFEINIIKDDLNNGIAFCNDTFSSFPLHFFCYLYVDSTTFISIFVSRPSVIHVPRDKWMRGATMSRDRDLDSRTALEYADTSSIGDLTCIFPSDAVFDCDGEVNRVISFTEKRNKIVLKGDKSTVMRNCQLSFQQQGQVMHLIFPSITSLNLPRNSRHTDVSSSDLYTFSSEKRSYCKASFSITVRRYEWIWSTVPPSPSRTARSLIQPSTSPATPCGRQRIDITS